MSNIFNNVFASLLIETKVVLKKTGIICKTTFCTLMDKYKCRVVVLKYNILPLGQVLCSKYIKLDITLSMHHFYAR